MQPLLQPPGASGSRSSPSAQRRAPQPVSARQLRPRGRPPAARRPTATDTLDVGLALDVEQLLATQPSELQALTADMTEEELEDLVGRGRDAWRAREIAKTPEQRDREARALLAREEELLQALTRYLDELYDLLGRPSDPDSPRYSTGSAIFPSRSSRRKAIRGPSQRAAATHSSRANRALARPGTARRGRRSHGARSVGRYRLAGRVSSEDWCSRWW